MSDLFSSLTSATRALQAQSFGLDVTGQNIANVNTPGYTRRVADLAAVPPESRWSAGRGVDVTGVRAERDRLIDRRLEHELSGASRESTLADTLSGVESVLGTSGQSIDGRLAAFFDSFARLADTPTSAVARQDVVQQGTALAEAFHDTADRLSQYQRDADRQLLGVVDQINGLSSQIARINQQLASTSEDTVRLHLQDQQGELVRQLAGLTDINVVERADGGLDVDVANGRALVVGASGYSLATQLTGANGQHQVTLGGVDITSGLTGGKAGGLIQARDVNIPDYLQRLDDQAFALADAVNTIHSAGYDLNGNTGQAFFSFTTAPTGTAGAARAITVDAAVRADATKIAASQSATLAGDNRNARALSDVRDARVLDGGTATLTESWSQLVYAVGRDVQAARSEHDVRQDIVTQVQTLRDQVSGVSLDEEAMQLMKFQRAYEANARFFSVIDQTLDVLFSTVAR